MIDFIPIENDWTVLSKGVTKIDEQPCFFVIVKSDFYIDENELNRYSEYLSALPEIINKNALLQKQNDFYKKENEELLSILKDLKK